MQIQNLQELGANIKDEVLGMKKFIYILLFILFINCQSYANIADYNAIQTHVDSVGVRLLNFNKIPKRIVFTYSDETKADLKQKYKALKNRQIIVYGKQYQFIQTDDELAGMLAREIATVMKSYSGMWGGSVDAVQVALSSKKFETVADKRAVDYMVKAGYNPLGLIVYINKTCPQKRQDVVARHNLTSKRLARIYEYITYKYPEYLNDNEYINNQYYQNFLLNSIENRRRLENKLKTGTVGEIDYE